ncbi:MAG: hypothetical protein AAFY38_08325 [Pseudomonadota bacterium]
MTHFMYRLVATVTLSLALALPASAQFEFQVSDLSRAEKRFLQAALALEGTYDAVLDGAWGPASRAALRKAARARGARVADADAVGAIARDAARILRDEGWGVLRELGGRGSYLLPLGRIDTRFSGDGDTVYVTSDGALRARDFTLGFGDVRIAHDRIRAQMKTGEDAYVVDRDSFIVTAVSLQDGRRAYLRSDSAGGGRWVSVLIEWRQGNQVAARSARLIAASIRLGQQSLPDPGQGALRAAMRGERPVAEPAPARPVKPDGGNAAVEALLRQLLAEIGRGSDPVPPVEPESGIPDAPQTRAGIGFYVNNTDFVILIDVLRACGQRGLALTDGTRARRLDKGGAGGMAIMTSRKRSAHWFPVSGGGIDFAARDLRAVTIANGGWADGTGQQVFPRFVSRVAVPGAEGQVFTGLPALKRHLGAPILDTNGAVVGVAAGAPQLGNVPERVRRELRRISRVVSTPGLPRFLASNGVVYQRTAPRARTYTLQPEKALVPLKCRD